MSILGDIFRGLLKVFCGGSGDQQSATQEQHPPPKQQQQPWQGQHQPHHQQQQHQPHPPSSPPHKPPQQHPPPGDRPPHGHSPSHDNGQAHPHFPPVSHHPSPPASSPPHGPGHHQDQNQINQHNEHYLSLRSRANEEGDKMARCLNQSHEAYQNGDGALAKDLSIQEKEHHRKMEELNREASDWIFVENNKDSKPGEIDLHGLYVKEAIVHTDRAIQEAKSRGDSEVHLIVGKGLHSPGGVAKIKPAIEEFMRNHQLVAELDPHNAGVLIVRMDGASGGEREVVGPDEITRKLERSEESCVIM